MIRRPSRSTLFPTRRSSDLLLGISERVALLGGNLSIQNQLGGGMVIQAEIRHPRAKKNPQLHRDRKSTRLNSSHVEISYAVFCLKKKKKNKNYDRCNIIIYI